MGDIAGIYGGVGFDTQTGEGLDSYDPLPAGWYTAMVDEAKVVETSKRTGWYLKLRFYILDQQYNGRKVFKNINIRNANAKAEEIGHKELTSFGRAIGLIMVNDSAECLNRQLIIKLKITRDEEYGDQNDVTGFKPLEGAPAQQPAPAPAAQAAYAPPPAQAAPAPAAQPAYQQQPAQPAAQPAQQPVYAPPPQPAAATPPPAHAPAPQSGALPWKRNDNVPF
ncbi:MAG: DUF669 domain-containing protein [Planctomycetaceae bacterium]|nr:DUF669 domain-containing protein [Planctomycetaceae bacterium]